MNSGTTESPSIRSQDGPRQGDKGSNPGTATSQLMASGRSLLLSEPPGATTREKGATGPRLPF